MGWFWQSPPRSPAEGKPAPWAKAAPEKRDEQTDMDPEIVKFLELFQAELRGDKSGEQGKAAPPAPPATASGQESPPENPTSSSSSWFSWRSSSPSTSAGSTNNASSSSADPMARRTATRAPEADAAEEKQGGQGEDVATSLLPTTMSCRDAFDRAFHCNSIGGQWTAIYRYGSVRQCSELWDDFWFCMRARAYSTERRAAEIRERWRQKEERKYYSPGAHSSEDVWEARERKVEPGTAFRASVAPADISDEDFRRLHEMRRRMLRGEMGFDDGAEGEKAGS